MEGLTLKLELEVALGDGALRFMVPTGVDSRLLLAALRAYPGVTDVVLTETRACVHFDVGMPAAGPWEISLAPPSTDDAIQTHVVPVRYDGEDLEEVARRADLSLAETIKLHTEAEYRVAMLGAFPGFAYLRGIDPRLALPRRDSVRPRVRANVLAIAAGYSAIYPFVWPNGWNIIGTVTDFVAFTADAGARLRLGDRVRFESVT